MNVYPSIEELAPREIQAIVPALLLEEIQERYETLGEKYVTDEKHHDGRRINGMMFTDRIVNCREEVIDAAFCIIGQIYKDTREGGVEPDDTLYLLLDGLCKIYGMCVAMEEARTYWNPESVGVSG